MSYRGELHLHEQLMLLALRDEKGTLESKATMYAYALGGAMLAELGLKGKIRISDDKKAFVDLVDRSPLGDGVLDECLDKVATAKRRARAATWVRRFAELKRLRHRVAQGLCRRGILRDDEGKVLLVFTRKLYPTINPVPERRLVDRLRDVVFSDSTSRDAETVIVAALANATGLLSSISTGRICGAASGTSNASRRGTRWALPSSRPSFRHNKQLSQRRPQQPPTLWSARQAGSPPVAQATRSGTRPRPVRAGSPPTAPDVDAAAEKTGRDKPVPYEAARHAAGPRRHPADPVGAGLVPARAGRSVPTVGGALLDLDRGRFARVDQSASRSKRRPPRLFPPPSFFEAIRSSRLPGTTRRASRPSRPQWPRPSLQVPLRLSARRRTKKDPPHWRGQSRPSCALGGPNGAMLLATAPTTGRGGGAMSSFAEFFSGIGLVREAVEPLGWHCVFANDIAPEKAEMYQGPFWGRSSAGRGRQGRCRRRPSDGHRARYRFLPLHRSLSRGQSSWACGAPLRDRVAFPRAGGWALSTGFGTQSVVVRKRHRVPYFQPGTGSWQRLRATREAWLLPRHRARRWRAGLSPRADRGCLSWRCATTCYRMRCPLAAI